RLSYDNFSPDGHTILFGGDIEFFPTIKVGSPSHPEGLITITDPPPDYKTFFFGGKPEPGHDVAPIAFKLYSDFAAGSYQLGHYSRPPALSLFTTLDCSSGCAGHDYSLTITAVPEPAGWALMILGFGLIGLTVRGRCSRAAA